MSDEQKARESEVFDQELSFDDLNAAAGGGECTMIPYECGFIPYGVADADKSNCTENWERPMYGGGGSRNCAATVEKDSCCNRNDGCYSMTVVYTGMHTDCGRAWE